MAICEQCGCEVHGQYCDMCGAKVHEQVSGRKPQRAEPSVPATAEVGQVRGQVRGQARRQTRQRTRSAGMPAQAPWQRRGLLWINALVGFAIFGGGLLVGFRMAASTTRPAAITGADTGDFADLSPAARAEALVNEGIGLLESGDQTAAVESFRKAAVQYESVVQADPENLFMRTYLGLTYYYTGDAVRARATELEVLDKDPDYLWAIFNLAWIQENSGNTSEALVLYQKYLDVAPAEKENVLKYAEQYELIDTQIAAASQSLENLAAGGGQ